MRNSLALALALLALTGCSLSAAPPGPVALNPSGGTCIAEPGQSFLGQIATTEVGAALLAATHARLLRWAPADSMITTEYSAERVTVGLDRNGRINQVSCG